MVLHKSVSGPCGDVPQMAGGPEGEAGLRGCASKDGGAAEREGSQQGPSSLGLQPSLLPLSSVPAPRGSATSRRTASPLALPHFQGTPLSAGNCQITRQHLKTGGGTMSTPTLSARPSICTFNQENEIGCCSGSACGCVWWPLRGDLRSGGLGGRPKGCDANGAQESTECHVRPP